MWAQHLNHGTFSSQLSSCAQSNRTACVSWNSLLNGCKCLHLTVEFQFLFILLVCYTFPSAGIHYSDNVPHPAIKTMLVIPNNCWQCWRVKLHGDILIEPIFWTLCSLKGQQSGQFSFYVSSSLTLNSIQNICLIDFACICRCIYVKFNNKKKHSAV